MVLLVTSEETEVSRGKGYALLCYILAGWSGVSEVTTQASGSSSAKWRQHQKPSPPAPGLYKLGCARQCSEVPGTWPPSKNGDQGNTTGTPSGGVWAG
jgi:hypothetical protein